MERAELAARLVAAGNAEREALLRQHSALADAQLAYALKDICFDDWSSSPARTTGAAAALKTLSSNTNDREVEALALWVEGFASVAAEGQIERGITLLKDSEKIFLSLGKPHMAALMQINHLYALALLGRYDEAVACGLGARAVLIAHGDLRGTAKIELTIGNIYLRRDLYQEAEKFLLAARERFAALNDQKQLAKIDNNLAIIYSSQHKFRRAEELYDQALKRARDGGFVLTQAEIEGSMGNLALFQGRYDRALDYLEQSRRKYAALGMPHHSAVAQQEIADAYLELNLAPEAAEIYERVTKTFSELGMQGERARALAQHGRALILLGRMEQAHALLAEARRLYAAEGNPVGEAMVTIMEAQLHHAEGNYQEASASALLAEEPLAAAGTWRRQLLARWLRGESARAEQRESEARTLLESTLADAELLAQPDIAQRCHTSLGLLAASAGQTERAADYFQRAVALIEDLRAPLPAEEFRTAFFADKLIPYNELVRLCLNDAGRDRTSEALCYVERARSRALLDVLGGSLRLRVHARDPFEAELLARLEELREELNWFYSRINRTPGHDVGDHSASEMTRLHEAVRERERETLEITRQLQQRKQSILTHTQTLDTAELQRRLSTDTALVEYTSLDGELLAFVATNEGIEVIRNLGDEEEAGELLGQLRFQIDALRYGARALRKHLPNLTERIQSHLQALHTLLMRPILKHTGERRLIIAPHRALYYIPFHALHDGTGYLIERREVAYAPSAVVLLHCLAQPQRPLQRALLMGVADEQTPRVSEEIDALAPLFPESIALLNERATLAALQEYAHGADILHLACHGQFRPDNPLFSSLRLGDGWLTVRDTYNLDLKCGLAALSACETGVNEVAPGDELIGLARGFFSAGAPSLLLSLWTVDDETTAELMASFYKLLLAGNAPAAALRAAQLEQLKKQPHPFFWSPFMIVGRP
ncbi:MAG TPA: CHAT domain-containing protein [Pyrinomonadaceae bacterium]|nr:CHAT domain-containing protein [Pyrinomonadaceae bacterium]